MTSNSTTKFNIPRLTYDLSEHCNLRCAGCDHASPWFQKKFPELQSYVKDLDALNQTCDIDEITFAGGEPLLHPQFVEFLKVSRKNNFSRKLRVFTNGTLLHKLPEDAFNYVDYIIISLYPGVRFRVDFKELAVLAKKHKVFIGIVIRHEFNYAILNTPIQNQDVVRAIHKGCMLRAFCHTIYDGRYYRCPRAHTLESRMQIIGVKINNRDQDSVSIHGNQSLHQELHKYLEEETPLTACNYCLGTVGAAMPTKQMKQTHLAEEQKLLYNSPLSLINPEVDLNDVSEVKQPKPGWIEEVFESLECFLDKVEQSGKTIEEYIVLSQDSMA